MDQAKAEQIAGQLLNKGFAPRTVKQTTPTGDQYAFIVQDEAGVDVSVLKTFADNQQVNVKARLIVIS